MNENAIKGQWKMIKGELRKKWGALTDDELDEVKGDTKKLEGLMQKKLGMKQEDAQREVNKFMDDYERSHPGGGGGQQQGKPGGGGGGGSQGQGGQGNRQP